MKGEHGKVVRERKARPSPLFQPFFPLVSLANINIRPLHAVAWVGLFKHRISLFHFSDGYIGTGAQVLSFPNFFFPPYSDCVHSRPAGAPPSRGSDWPGREHCQYGSMCVCVSTRCLPFVIFVCFCFVLFCLFFSFFFVLFCLFKFCFSLLLLHSFMDDIFLLLLSGYLLSRRLPHIYPVMCVPPRSSCDQYV